LQNGKLVELRKQRYASFDVNAGKAFENGELTLSDMRLYAINHGEPQPMSGRQEYLENLVNRFL
jgi:xylose isomerase